MRNEDVSKVIDELGAARARADAEQAQLAANWRRLREMREGLSRELAMVEGQPLEEDIDLILERMLGAETRAAAEAGRRARAARAALADWDAGHGWVARLSRGWKATRRKLAAAAEAASQREEASASVLAARTVPARMRANVESRAAREANARAAAPNAALRDRIAGLDAGLAAARAGVEPALTCLRRWDIPALVRISALHRKLQVQGRLSETDWAFYDSAGLSAPVSSSGRIPSPLDPAAPAAAAPGGASDEGDVLRIRLLPDGAVVGETKRAFRSVPAGTDIASLPLEALAAMLGGLRMEGLELDADLLEAYLDATARGWREGGGLPPAEPQAADPYVECLDVFGLAPGATIQEVRGAFMAQMQALSGLPNSAPQRRLVETYQKLTKLMAAGRGKGE